MDRRLWLALAVSLSAHLALLLIETASPIEEAKGGSLSVRVLRRI